MKPLSAVILSSLVVMLAACTTPQAALQQANHTTSLMAELDRELAAFRHTRTVAEQAQRESIQDQQKALAEARVLSGPWIRSRTSAGDKAPAELMQKLIADAEALATDETEAANALKANDEAVAKLMTPLPGTNTALTKAQTNMALMGEELPAATRAVELRKFAQAVRDNIDANRKKIDEAQAAAAAKK